MLFKPNLDKEFEYSYNVRLNEEVDNNDDNDDDDNEKEEKILKKLKRYLNNL